MFFNVDLLCLQRGGKFALLWIAATRGVESINVKDIFKLDLDHIADEIAKYITSESSHPRNRFSLVISSKLICGLAKLQLKLTNYHYDCTLKFLTIVRKPDILREEKRKPRKHPKKKAITSAAPDTNLEEITDEDFKALFSEVTAHEEVITLREETGRKVTSYLEEEEAFGFGTVAYVEEVKRTIPENLTSSTALQDVSAVQITVQADVHAPPREKRQRSPREEQSSKKTKRVPRIRELDEIQLAGEKEPPKRVEQQAEEEIGQDVAKPGPSEEPTMVEKAAPVPKKKGAIKKPKPQKDLSQVPLPTDKRKCINRSYSDAYLLYDKEEEEEEYPVFEKKHFMISDTDNPYLLEKIDEVYSNEDLELDLARKSTTRNSLSASIHSLRERLSHSFGVVGVRDVASEMVLRTSEAQLRPPRTSQAQEERMTAIHEEAMVNLPDFVKMGTIEETTLPPIGHTNGNAQAVINVVPIAPTDRNEAETEESTKLEKHFVALKTNLLDWNWTEGFPTIDDVSPRPLNRLNVALTFTLLLELDRRRQVYLVTDERTYELQHIEKGSLFDELNVN